MKRYKIKINQEKLEEVKSQLKPGRSYWALAGIILFFFVPEIIALFWGESIVSFFQAKEAEATGAYKLIYKTLQSLGENSLFNIALGVAFVVWFFKERKKKAHSKKE